ncbi:MAG: hypothetical protein MJ185_07780 [Treponema sp.]|nr:hypothetical protein [Treponema sp.]
MKKSILPFALSLAACLMAFSCTTPTNSSWGKNSPCSRIIGETMNSISTIGTTPVNAGQENYMKAKAGDYFSVSYKANEGNCKVEISKDKEILYIGNDMVGTMGREKSFSVKVGKSGTYKVLVDTEDFLGTVTVEKKSK